MNLWKIFGYPVTANKTAAPKLYQAICVCNRIINNGKTTEIVARANPDHGLMPRRSVWFNPSAILKGFSRD